MSIIHEIFRDSDRHLVAQIGNVSIDVQILKTYWTYNLIFMLPFFSKYKPIVGLDIGTTAIRAVEIRPAGSGWRLHRWGNQPLPPTAIEDGKVKNSEEVISALRTLFEKTGFSTKRVAMSVGGPSVVIKSIQLPFMTEMELEDQISLEAEEHIPFGIDDVNLDFQILNQDQEQLNVLLTACKKEPLEERLKIIEGAGLVASVCDLEICCLINAHDAFIAPGSIGLGNKKKKKKSKKKAEAEQEKPDSKTVVALVNCGGSYLNVAIFLGEIPVYTRDYNVGVRQLIQQISQELEVPLADAEQLLQGGKTPEEKEVLAEHLPPFEEQLASTIKQSINFYKQGNSGHPVQELTISGPCTHIGGLDQRLSEKLEISVKFSNPLSGLKPGSGSGCQPMSKSSASRFMLALGLALRGDMP
ncbi:MAG: type IV pilus assembly protein PilM [Magnetococcales bacterium]|nr:type IV pilus assembly protein PilM [Magnetococcales bacterium]